MSRGRSEPPCPSRSSVITRLPRAASALASGSCMRVAEQQAVQQDHDPRPARRTSCRRGGCPVAEARHRRGRISANLGALRVAVYACPCNLLPAAVWRIMPHGSHGCARGRAADLGARPTGPCDWPPTSGWWRSCARATSAAFEAIYDRHHRGLLAFCRHMLGSPRGGRGRAPAHVPRRLPRAARTDEPIAAARRGSTRSPATAAFDAARPARAVSLAERRAEPSAERPVADEVAAARGPARRCSRDLDGLPDDQRAALVLAELGDLRHEEIARGDRRAASKVKALVFQARESLIARAGARHAVRGDPRAARDAARRRAAAHRPAPPPRRRARACRAYREEVRRQRAALALVLPVAAQRGLKETVLAAALGGGGAAGGGAAIGGSLAGGAALLKGTAAKVAIGVVALGSTVTGGVVGVEQISGPPSAPATKAPETIAARPAAAPATGAAVRARRTATSTAPATGSRRATAERRRARQSAAIGAPARARLPRRRRRSPPRRPLGRCRSRRSSRPRRSRGSSPRSRRRSRSTSPSRRSRRTSRAQGRGRAQAQRRCRARRRRRRPRASHHLRSDR